ncbi:hypothetical protein H8B09_25650 [Paenibacillus sp. PR3]|uniref:Uncharacterized protein n=1 Tax=Paenibacillus terricola TaxID=2763503 RepID=A0ABR8N1V7_9BACL|nr:hypothetical protein [Paenibacillus terricola]MBD3922166.1 hypothetical protein [Paenibacillus terricola]
MWGWDFLRQQKNQEGEKLREPISIIMNDGNAGRFDLLWDTFRANLDSLHLYKVEMEWVKSYTGERLDALSHYFDKLSRRERYELRFYTEYADLLLSLRKKLDTKGDDGIMQYMYFYSELLLGSR